MGMEHLLIRTAGRTCLLADLHSSTDGNGIGYSGDSAVIDPLGKVVFEKADDACSATLTLSHEVLTEYRRQFPAWKDADIIIDHL